MQIEKGYTGTDSDGDSSAKSQWKLVKFHLIGTDIDTKMGTVAIGMRISTCIGIGIGSLETLLHIIIIAIFIGIRIGIGIEIGVGQWKHTIRVNKKNAPPQITLGSCSLRVKTMRKKSVGCV